MVQPTLCLECARLRDRIQELETTLLSIRQIETECHISKDRILTAIHAGDLSAINIAKPDSLRPRWRVTRFELDRWLKSQRTSSFQPETAPRLHFDPHTFQSWIEYPEQPGSEDGADD